MYLVFYTNRISNVVKLVLRIRSEKRQRQTVQFLKYGVMTTYSRSVHAAVVLSLFLASQNLMGQSAPPSLVPLGGAVYNGSWKQ